MDYKVIAEGSDISQLGAYDSQIAPGQQVQVVAYVSAAPPGDTLAGIEQNLISQGVTLTAPVVYSPDIGAVIVSVKKPEAQSNSIGAMPEGLLLPSVGAGLVLLTIAGITIMGISIISSMGGGSSSTVGIWVVIGLILFVLFISSQEGKATVKTATKVAGFVGAEATKRMLSRPYGGGYGTAEKEALKWEKEKFKLMREDAKGLAAEQKAAAFRGRKEEEERGGRVKPPPPSSMTGGGTGELREPDEV